MLNAAVPFCDNAVQSRSAQSIVRQALLMHYSQNPGLRNEYIQYACIYAQALMSRGNPWQNAISAAAEAVAPVFMYRLAQSDQQVANAFAQNPQAANETAQAASNVENTVRMASQQMPAYNNMQQPQMQSPLAGAYVSSMTNMSAHMPGVSPGTNMSQAAASNAVVLSVPTSNAYQQPTQSNMTSSQVNAPRKNTPAVDLMDAHAGIPPLHNKEVLDVEYFKHNGIDYFKENPQMDPNAHNHSPAFFMEATSKTVANIVSNDPVTGSNGLVKVGSAYHIKEVQSHAYTRALSNSDKVVYAITDLPNLEAQQTHIIHMPTMEMVIAADLAKSESGCDASAVRDAELVEKIIYCSSSETYNVISEIFTKSKNVMETAAYLAQELDTATRSAQSNVDHVVAVNSTIRAFVKIINSYVQTASKKPNLKSNTIDSVTDIKDLMQWMEKNDNPLYRSLMEQVQYNQWINHNFIINTYEGTNNFTIESRKAVVYSTMLFQQLGCSFSDNCDKAVLNEDINPWLYHLFSLHLLSSAGRRIYTPVRYFFKDDVTIDVIMTNAILGQMLVKLVE